MSVLSSPSITINLPDWALQANRDLPEVLPNPIQRMETVLEFARRNPKEGTGGPFAAGVFEEKSGRPVIIGVNRVMPLGCSSAHAEVVALSLAQQLLGSFDLGAPGMPAYQLVVNWRPCTMCFGALLWSGIRSLLIAGSGGELETITGFDEGPVHPRWREELEKRGISLQEDVLRDRAIQGFHEFADGGHPVYNGRGGDLSSAGI